MRKDPSEEVRDQRSRELRFRHWKTQAEAPRESKVGVFKEQKEGTDRKEN